MSGRISKFSKHQKVAYAGLTELNCDGCDFQASSGPELKNKLNAKQRKAENGVKELLLKVTHKNLETLEMSLVNGETTTFHYIIELYL